MIYYISGILKDKQPTSVIIDVNGMGYELRIPLSTFEELPAVNQVCSLFTYLYLSLNQDEIRLYGFATQAEKAVFSRLISISGIGPKIGLSVLSSLSLGLFIKAVQSAEEGLLAKVPGIGKKTAQRIIIELKDDILHFVDLLDSTAKASIDVSLSEVEKALTGLGYASRDIQRALPQLSEAERQLPVEQVIKQVIRIIYQKS